jgi:hypothetical protein
MTRLSDEELQALIDGCEGVTSGPFGAAGGYLTTRNPDGRSFGQTIYHLDEMGQASPSEPFQAVPFAKPKDAAHFSRCGPATIRALATEVLESRGAMHGLSVTRDTITDVATESLAGRKRIAELKAEVKRLREAVAGVLPPSHGIYGGPLVQMIARYEDGTDETSARHKGTISHEAVARARAALGREG